LPVIDCLLAATALQHGLALVTRHIADVIDTGASVYCPWPGTG
jgi:predicted nucleic acid-binding protein